MPDLPSESKTFAHRSLEFLTILLHPMHPSLIQLETLLERRLAVIANHELRDRDPDAQLQQLQEVSEQIQQFHGSLRGQLEPRLNHFLTQCSFSKALDWIRESRTSSGS